MIKNRINFIDSLNGPKFKRREISSATLDKKPAEPINYEKRLPAKKRNWKTAVSAILIIVIIFIAFSTNILFSSSSFLNNLTSIKAEDSESTSLWVKVKRLIGAEENLLKGESLDRINILLLGQGGVGHEGPYLTDTIILVSIKPSTNQVAAISIPRDLYVPIDKNGWKRINYANSFGETEMDGQGGEIASQTVSDVFNIPIHYYARIDFEGFKKVIDDLGGVNVFIEKNFTDSRYPTYNYGTTTLTFEKGWQKMDGETALQFARSRHGNNGEAGDFARAKRQQKIIIAIKEKAFSFGSLFQPHKFLKAAKDFNEHFTTNLKTWEIISLSKFAKGIDLNHIITKTIDDSPTGPLVGIITEDGAFVLKTKTDNFYELENIAKNIFLNPSEAQVQETQKENQEKRELLQNINNENHAKIIVQNGTLASGLAKKTADYLASLEFSVLEFSNAPTQDTEKTIIYDFTENEKKYNLEYLKENLNTTESKKSNLSDFEGLNPEAEFLVIIGADYIEPIVPEATTNKIPTIEPQISTSTEN